MPSSFYHPRGNLEIKVLILQAQITIAADVSLTFSLSFFFSEKIKLNIVCEYSAYPLLGR